MTKELSISLIGILLVLVVILFFMAGLFVGINYTAGIIRSNCNELIEEMSENCIRIDRSQLYVYKIPTHYYLLKRINLHFYF